MVRGRRYWSNTTKMKSNWADNGSAALSAGGEALAAPCLHATLPVTRERAGRPLWGSTALLPSWQTPHPSPASRGSPITAAAMLQPEDAGRGSSSFHSTDPKRLQQGLGASLSDTARCVTRVGLVRLAGCCLPFRNLQCLPMFTQCLHHLLLPPQMAKLLNQCRKEGQLFLSILEVVSHPPLRLAASVAKLPSPRENCTTSAI